MRKTIILAMTAAAASTAAAVGALGAADAPQRYSIATRHGVVEVIPYSNDIFRIVESSADGSLLPR